MNIHELDVVPCNRVDRRKDSYNPSRKTLDIITIKESYKYYNIFRRYSVEKYYEYFICFTNTESFTINRPISRNGYGRYNINISSIDRELGLTTARNIKLVKVASDDKDIVIYRIEEI